MFSLITNKTYQASHRANHVRNMFILSMIETLQGSFDLSQTKHVSANVVFLLNTVALPYDICANVFRYLVSSFRPGVNTA